MPLNDRLFTLLGVLDDRELQTLWVEKLRCKPEKDGFATGSRDWRIASLSKEWRAVHGHTLINLGRSPHAFALVLKALKRVQATLDGVQGTVDRVESQARRSLFLQSGHGAAPCGRDLRDCGRSPPAPMGGHRALHRPADWRSCLASAGPRSGSGSGATGCHSLAALGRTDGHRPAQPAGRIGQRSRRGAAVPGPASARGTPVPAG